MAPPPLFTPLVLRSLTLANRIALAPPDVALHTAEFAHWAASEEGDKAVLDGAKAMAMTVVDLWLAPDAAEEVRAAFGSGP